MTLRQRRLLYLSFIVLFLLITPAVSFYAAGYNFDWRTGEVQRTAILIVESEPRGATITLEAQTDKYNWLYDIVYGDTLLQTPEKIRKLLPGEYRVRIERDGYVPYERQLRLQEGTTVVLNDIPLFRKPKPQPIVPGGVRAIEPSANGRLLAVASEGSLSVVTSATGERVVAPAAADSSAPQLSWSAGNTYLLYAGEQFAVHAADTVNQRFVLADSMPVRPRLAQWDARNDAELIAVAGTTLYRVNAATQFIEPLVSGIGDARAIASRDGVVYVVTANSAATMLRMYQAADGSLMQTVSLPPGSTYDMRVDSDAVYVHETQREMLYIVRPGMFLPLEATLSGVADFKMTNNTITYWNRFELWQYHIADAKKTLIARLSSPVAGGIPYTDERYVLYATADAMNMAELREGRYRASFTLLDWDGISAIYLGRDGEFVYIVSPYGESDGLYRIELR